MFLSYNGVQGINAVKNCIQNILGDHYAKTGNINCEIIIQETINTRFAGVTLFESALSKCYMESYYGSCRGVVDGVVVPYISTLEAGRWSHIDNVHITKSKFIVSNHFIDKVLIPLPGQKLNKVSQAFELGNIRFLQRYNAGESMVYGVRKMPSSSYRQSMDNILKEILKVAPYFKKGVDAEWGINEQGILFFFQARALTRSLAQLSVDENTTMDVLNETTIKGLPASSGCVTGTVTQHSNATSPCKKILFIREATIENVEYLRNFKAVISQFGGILSHLAIVCREQGIPCVVGIQAQIAEGTEVSIDGKSGTVKILAKV